jgi:nicotinamidase/pyrazinamidase
MDKRAALLIIDVQNDFCTNGALEVPGNERVIEPLNRAAECFTAEGLPILASRDWHPPVTRHFSGYGGVWPPHCVQESSGAAFHPALRLPQGTLVISKGMDPDSDSYSVFDGSSVDGRSLQKILEELQVRHLYIGGLATDYCVCSSVLDARKAGFEVTVLADAIAGVDLVAGDSEKARLKMMNSGVNFCRTDEALIHKTYDPEK